MAPLYNAGPILTEAETPSADVELRLASEVASSTIEQIEAVVESFEESPKQRRSTTRALLPRRLCTKFGVPALLTLLVVIGLIVSGLLAIIERERCVRSPAFAGARSSRVAHDAVLKDNKFTNSIQNGTARQRRALCRYLY